MKHTHQSYDRKKLAYKLITTSALLAIGFAVMTGCSNSGEEKSTAPTRAETVTPLLVLQIKTRISILMGKAQPLPIKNLPVVQLHLTVNTAPQLLYSAQPSRGPYRICLKVLAWELVAICYLSCGEIRVRFYRSYEKLC